MLGHQRTTARAAPDPHAARGEEAPVPHVVDWDTELPPAVVDWDAEDGAGYHVDWDAAPVLSPLVTDWDNFSVSHRPSEEVGTRPAREETRHAHTSKLLPKFTAIRAFESQALDHQTSESREPAVVDWDADEVRGPILMDWDGVSTRDTYPLPGRNSIMALGIVDWDGDAIRKPVLMDWDKDAQTRPLVTDWDLITPGRSSGSRSATESSSEKWSEVWYTSDMRQGKKWVVDDVLLQAAAKAGEGLRGEAQTQRWGPGRSTIMRSNLVDWDEGVDEELEREAKAREEAEAKAREAEARAREAEERAAEAEERAKAKAQIRAKKARPKAGEIPKKLMGAGGSVWQAPEEPEELGMLQKLGKKIGKALQGDDEKQGPEKPEEVSEITFGSKEITERPVKVEVEIEQAYELTAPPGVEAYVTASLEAESKTLVSKNTETAEKSPEPVLDEILELELLKPPFARELKLVVYKYMKFSYDRVLGIVNIPLESLPLGKEHSMMCDLVNEGGEPQKGKLQIHVTLTPIMEKKKEPTPPPTPTPEPSETDLPQHVVEAKAVADQTRQMVESAATSGVHERVPQEPVRAKVRVVEGKKVYDPSKPEGGGAFCKVILGSTAQRTKDRAGVLRRDPIWKQDFELEGPVGTPAIVFQFLDWRREFVKDDQGMVEEVTRELFLGALFVSIGSLPLGEEKDEWYKIRGGLAENAQVRLKITLLSGHVFVDLPGFPPHVHPATSDDNQFMPSGPQSSGWLPLTVPSGITSMGWVPVGMAPERMFIEAILPASWAAHAKLVAEDELISIAGKDIADYSEESLMEVLQDRPLELVFYRHDWDDDGAAEEEEGAIEQEGSHGDAEKTDAEEEDRDEELKKDRDKGKGKEEEKEKETATETETEMETETETETEVETKKKKKKKKQKKAKEGEEEEEAKEAKEKKKQKTKEKKKEKRGGLLRRLFRFARTTDEEGVLEEEGPDEAEEKKKLDAEALAKKKRVLRDLTKESQLQLDVLEGRNLWAMTKGEVFTIVGVQGGGKPHVTKVQVGANPQWNESSVLMIPPRAEEIILEVSVWDLELSERDEHLGALDVPLDQLKVGEVADWWCVLQGGNAMPGAEVRLRLQLLEKGGKEDEGSLDSLDKISAPKSDSLGPVHLLLEIEEATGLVKYGETHLPENVDAFVVFDTGPGAKPYVTASVLGMDALKWRERTLMEVTSGTTELIVTVWDKALQIEEKPLGKVFLNLHDLPIGRAVDEWYDLVDGVCSEAKLRLRVTLVNTLTTQDPFADFSDSDEGEHGKKLAQQIFLHRVRRLHEPARLKVDVLEGWDLAFKCNAYARISLGHGSQMQKTGTAVRASHCPKWEKENSLVFDLPPAQEVLEVSIWDEDPFGQGDDLMGVVHISTDKLQFGQAYDEWYNLAEGPIQTSKVRLCLYIRPLDKEVDKLEHHLKRITIDVLEASDLRDPDDPSGTDPYVVLSIGEDPYVTKTVKGKEHQNPQWNETATLEIHRDTHALQVSVWDWDPWSKEDLLGSVRIPFGTLPVNQLIDEWYDIREGLSIGGKVHLKILLEGVLEIQEEKEEDEVAVASDQPPEALLLRVEIIEGVDMTEPTEPDGAESYVILSIDDQASQEEQSTLKLSEFVTGTKAIYSSKFFTSAVAQQSRNPKWNEIAETWVLEGASFFEVQVWDSDYLRDDKLGIARIPLKSLTLNESEDNWYDLAEGIATHAKIHLKVTLEGEESQCEDLRDVDEEIAVATISAPPQPTRHLKVEVVDGNDMANPGGSCDPYAILSIEGDHHEFRTKTIKESLFPEWNEITTFVLPTEATALEINVWDSNYLSDTLVGKAFVVFETLPLGSEVEQWYSLGDGSAENARVRLRLTLAEQDMMDMLGSLDALKTGTVAERPRADLKVEILQGSNITEPSEPDGCDAYAIVSLGDGQSHTTQSQKQNPSPEWDESVYFDLQPEVEFLDLNVWDDDILDECLGAARVPLDGLNYGEPREEWYEISGGVAEDNPKILLRLTLAHKEQPTADLKIEILEGQNMLEPSDPAGCDAYVVVSLGDGQSYTTYSVKKNHSPQWNETVNFKVKLESEKFLALNAWDYNYSSDGHLGKTRVPLEALKSGEWFEDWYELSGGNMTSGDEQEVEEQTPPKVLLRLTITKKEPPKDLKIDILRGRNLMEQSTFDGCDAYVIVSLADGQSHTTKSVKQDVNPEWNDTVTFELQADAEKMLHVDVWDWDVLSADDHLGAVHVPLGSLMVKEPLEQWYDLRKVGGANKGAGVQLRLTLLKKKGPDEESEEDPEEQKMAKLKVVIVEGSNVKANCSLYIMLSLGEGSSPFKTQKQNSGITRKPKWNESTLLKIPPGTEALEVSLWDGNYLSVDDNLGKFSIPLLAFQDANDFDWWYEFEGGTGFGAGGKVRLQLKLLDPRILLNLPEQRLRVDIVEGKDLTDDPRHEKECSAWLAMEIKGDDDPPYKTQRIQRDRCPKWDESTIFSIQSMLETTQLEINVWSHFLLHLEYTKDFLGMTRIPLGRLRVGQEVDEWYDISGGKPTHAQIRLRLLVLEDEQPHEEGIDAEQGSKQEMSDNAAFRGAPLKALALSEDFRHGQLLFEVNRRRVPYVVVPRGLKDFSRLLPILLFNWGLPSPANVLRALGGEKHLYSEWLDSCRDLLCWAPKEGALPENPEFEEAHYSSGVRAQSVGRLPVTEDIMSDYFANFLSKMEAFAFNTCENAVATDSWLESDASTMGIAGLLGVGARCVLRSLQAKKFVWLGLYNHPSQIGGNESWNERNIRKLWDAAVPVNEEVVAPIRIPLEETPQIPQSRTLPGECEEDWNIFRNRHQVFINPWITHLLLFYDIKDREGWYDYVGHNLSVVGMMCNDFVGAGFERKVLLVNHSGGMCDHWAEALKQDDVQKLVHRVNASGVFHEPIKYEQHQRTFQKLGGAWACDLLAKMLKSARTADYLLNFQGQNDMHTKKPNQFIQKMAAKYTKRRYIIEPPPPPELPEHMTRDEVVILDLATDSDANIRQRVYDCLSRKDLFQRIEEESDKVDKKAASPDTRTHDQKALAPSLDEMAMKEASVARKKVAVAPRCRFCGAEAPKKLLDSNLDPSLAAPEEAKGGFNLEGLMLGCKCHGKNQLYHLACLQTDFIVRREAHETTWLDFRCQICRRDFHGHALLELAHISKGRLTAKHGSHSPEVAQALRFLGVAHIQIGEHEVAAQLLADSLSISEEQHRLTGDFTNEMAETLHCLAKCYRRPADTLKERRALERCLAIKEKVFGSGHEGTRSVMLDLAAAYARAGETRKEREVLNKVRTLNAF